MQSKWSRPLRFPADRRAGSLRVWRSAEQVGDVLTGRPPARLADSTSADRASVASRGGRYTNEGSFSMYGAEIFGLQYRMRLLHASRRRAAPLVTDGLQRPRDQGGGEQMCHDRRRASGTDICAVWICPLHIYLVALLDVGPPRARHGWRSLSASKRVQARLWSLRGACGGWPGEPAVCRPPRFAAMRSTAGWRSSGRPGPSAAIWAPQRGVTTRPAGRPPARRPASYRTSGPGRAGVGRGCRAQAAGRGRRRSRGQRP